MLAARTTLNLWRPETETLRLIVKPVRCRRGRKARKYPGQPRQQLIMGGNHRSTGPTNVHTHHHRDRASHVRHKKQPKSRASTAAKNNAAWPPRSTTQFICDKLARARKSEDALVEQLMQHELDEVAWEAELARCRRLVAVHEASEHRADDRHGARRRARRASAEAKVDYAHQLGCELAALRWLVEEDGLQRDRLSARAQLLAHQKTCLAALRRKRGGDTKALRDCEATASARLQENAAAAKAAARREKARKAELATARAKQRVRVRFFGAVSDVTL